MSPPASWKVVSTLLALLVATLATGGAAADLVDDTAYGSSVSLRLGPGASITAESGGTCTASFVFRNGDTGRLALATAGHCFELGARVSVLHVEPRGPTWHATPFGTVALRVRDAGVGNDFALVEVDLAHEASVDPTVPVFGGPCGWRDTQGVGEAVGLAGRTLLFEGPVKPRVGVTRADGDLVAGHPNVVHYAIPRTGGDSGAPVLFLEADDARSHGVGRPAAAIHTTGTLAAAPLGTGTSLRHALSLAPGWSLVDSPTCARLLPDLAPSVRVPVPLPDADQDPQDALVDDDGDGQADGVSVRRSSYEADPTSSEPMRQSSEGALEARTRAAPEVHADGDDRFTGVIGGPVVVRAPDGREMSITVPLSDVAVVVRFDGTVLSARDVTAGCAEVDPALVQVTGRLDGAGADGTWRVSYPRISAMGGTLLGKDFILDVQGKRMVDAADPDAHGPDACPTIAHVHAQDRAWNWHLSGRVHETTAISALAREESPEGWRFFPAG